MEECRKLSGAQQGNELEVGNRETGEVSTGVSRLTQPRTRRHGDGWLVSFEKDERWRHMWLRG